ncbi:MAG TPA: hypothetical protein VG779_04205 [Actinomycetota bacterium]|nr:hypothetical protein [Actinomycetota bacterium]
MTPTPPGDPDADISEIRVFLLTEGDVLAQEGEGSLFCSVARPVEDAPAAPTPAQLRNFKRMHPAYQGRLWRADGPARTPAAAPAGRTRKMEIYDPLTSSWSAVPPGAGPAKVGDAVCGMLPDGRFLIGGIASASCATYDPDTDRWSTTSIGAARSGNSRRSGGPASVIVVRMSN